MASKHQNCLALVGVGFVLGFISGYKYSCKRSSKSRKELYTRNLRVAESPSDSGSDSGSESGSGPAVEGGSVFPKDAPPPPPSDNFFPASYSDTYARLDELVPPAPSSLPKPPTELSVRQKFSLMEDYSYIISMTYSQACRLVAKKGYSLRVKAVRGCDRKLLSESFSTPSFEVEIEDHDYDFHTNSPSKHAVIVSIIDVTTPRNKNNV